MPNRTRAQIAADIASKFANNTSGSITEAKLREVVTDIIDSFPNLTDDPRATTSHTHVKANITDLGTIGTAAALNVPASGNAASGEVVKGDDTRMSNARTPTAHTHPAVDISDSTSAGRGLVTAADSPAQRSLLGLGTAATLNVASSGNAASGEVVKGDDTRLGGLPALRSQFRYETDFDESATAGWTTSVGTGGAITFGSGEQLNPGIVVLSTGTTGLGTANFTRGQSTVLFGGGVWTFESDIQIPTLSTSAERYVFRIGWADTSLTDGVYFEYDESVTANWRMCAANNATRTRTNTSTAVGTAWTRLRIVVNAAGTSADYFINGTNVGTVTTNIPTGSGRECGACALLAKTVTTANTALTVKLDYYTHTCDLTTAR